MKYLHKKKTMFGILGITTVMALLIAAFQQSLTLQTYKIQTNKIDTKLRLMVITDLHSTIYGKEQSALISRIEENQPDVILMVGDIADDKVAHEGTKLLLADIGSRYPCYYVSGNHEIWSGQSIAIKELFRSYGVTVLEGESELISVKGQFLQIHGVDDPARFVHNGTYINNVPSEWVEQFNTCQANATDTVYNILLSHRPELTDFYTDSDFDLVLSGHAHGGQVRIPGILNGLYAPNQGLFPKYAGGLYELGTTTMVVSRGLCKNNLPRVFNPPELVIVDLFPMQ